MAGITLWELTKKGSVYEGGRLCGGKTLYAVILCFETQQAEAPQ